VRGEQVEAVATAVDGARAGFVAVAVAAVTADIASWTYTANGRLIKRDVDAARGSAGSEVSWVCTAQG
jgi:hypothetical protein